MLREVAKGILAGAPGPCSSESNLDQLRSSLASTVSGNSRTSTLKSPAPARRAHYTRYRRHTCGIKYLCVSRARVTMKKSELNHWTVRLAVEKATELPLQQLCAPTLRVATPAFQHCLGKQSELLC
jgi:hypothetical protein